MNGKSAAMPGWPERVPWAGSKASNHVRRRQMADAGPLPRDATRGRWAASEAPKENGDGLRSPAQAPVSLFPPQQPSTASGVPEGRQAIAGGASPRKHLSI